MNSIYIPRKEPTMTQKRILLRLLPIAAAALLIGASAHAQRPGGFGGPPMPPEMQAKMKAWDIWRGTHQNVVSLQRTLGGLTRLEDTPATKLTKPQAKAMLAVLKKWQAKPSITDAQAKQINTQLTGLLSTAQRQQMTVAGPGRGGFGSGRPSGFGRPGGFGGRPEGRPGGGFGRPGGFNPASFPAPREYNPLNPATQPVERMRDRAAKQHARLIAALMAAAK